MAKMINNECPNCAGKLTLVDEDKYVCYFCDSEFELKNDDDARMEVFVDGMIAAEQMVNMQTEQRMYEDDGQAPAERLFFVKANELKKDNMKTWEVICNCINQGLEPIDYLGRFNEFAAKTSTISTLDTNSELIVKMMNVVDENLAEDEVGIVYKDAGIFSSGKVGCLITNFSLYCIKKDRYKRLDLVNLNLLETLSYTNNWRFSDALSGGRSARMEIDDIGCSAEELGMMIAYMCTSARNLNDIGFQITFDVIQ